MTFYRKTLNMSDINGNWQTRELLSNDILPQNIKHVWY